MINILNTWVDKITSRTKQNIYFSGKVILVYLLGLFALWLFLQLSKKLINNPAFQIQWNIFNHQFTFPSMTKNLFWSLIVMVILGACGSLFSLFYLKHKKTTQDKNSEFSKKPLVLFLIYAPLYEVLNILTDELVASFSSSLGTTMIKEKYFWFSYLGIFTFLILGYTFDIMKIHSINKLIQEKKKEQLNFKQATKKYLIRFGILACLSSLILLASVAINRLPENWANFELAITILEQPFEIISNQNQTIIIVLIQMILFGLAYNLIDAIENKEYKNYIKNIPKDILFSIISACGIIALISIINNIGAIDPSSPVILLPLFLLGIVWSFCTFITIKQFTNSAENIIEAPEDEIELAEFTYRFRDTSRMIHQKYATNIN